MRFNHCLAALAATAAFASPAFAQTTDTKSAQARGVVLQPLTLTWVKDLNFGTILSTALAGRVSIDADTGKRGVLGGVSEISLDKGGRAEFNGLGTVGREVDITLTPAAVLKGPGPDITVLDMDLDSGGGMSQTRTIPAGDGGAFVIGVGGEFAIAANQGNGVYTGTFSVTADYK
jgi:hypothetical protein